MIAFRVNVWHPCFMKIRWALFSAVFLALLAATTDARALVLNWDTIVWPAGSLTNSFDLNADAVNDIKITISGDTAGAFALGPISTNRTGLGAPNNIINGGTIGDEYSLLLYISAAGWTLDTQSITVTVDFLSYGGATGVNYKLFDVDVSGPGFPASTNSPGTAAYDDQIRGIRGSNSTGYVGATVTGSLSNQVLGTAGTTNQTVRGIGSVGGNTNLGNVTIDFGTTTVINQFQFTWGNDASSTSSNPGIQLIGFHDINFLPIIPEHGTASMSLLVCLLAVVGIRFVHVGQRLKPLKVTGR